MIVAAHPQIGVVDIFVKLQVAGRAEAVIAAREAGLGR